MAGRSELLDLLEQRGSPVLSHRRAKHLWKAKSHRSDLYDWNAHLPFCLLPQLRDGVALPPPSPLDTRNQVGSQGTAGLIAVYEIRVEAVG